MACLISYSLSSSELSDTDMSLFFFFFSVSSNCDMRFRALSRITLPASSRRLSNAIVLFFSSLIFSSCELALVLACTTCITFLLAFLLAVFDLPIEAVAEVFPVGRGVSIQKATWMGTEGNRKRIIHEYLLLVSWRNVGASLRDSFSHQQIKLEREPEVLFLSQPHL
eukprot:GFKZ01004991.1.p1 GENE.GFKZ01004991.1~~GFKZ01004991.1.p1  ORF type:complete len:167 (+),score=13.39 GFKZ01004991.1:255-755(+)